ncbi:hypothetical protein BU24DRAFT_195431 [Aaosphaeria arxii CBS 175.79]|uniref:Uncharacterized protein n=1 Tax=Aaosphaeria arxii CBS 175.79 TaxID=1450172 RepID=A0A6A5XS60_9PLEO|nr:uncharacterized protein BU24DRAFT_195431 [Aaosphaeria arxii CBS 175.79]KAF2016175.1 hypothetical protein BU24DRAFT_195431 [Aaosphaeria arxii CBS 175.79]
MVYEILYDRISRTGQNWSTNIVNTLPPENLFPPALVSNSNISEREEWPVRGATGIATLMSTCRQVHSELAEMLYSIPLEFPLSFAGDFSLPISKTYSHLIKRVMIPFQGMSFDNPRFYWGRVLHLVREFAKLFPQTDIIRAIWSSFSRRHSRLNFYYGLAEGTREAHVKRCVKYIRSFSKLNPEHIPHQLEVLMQDNFVPEVLFDTPFSEAVRRLRSKAPKSRK